MSPDQRARALRLADGLSSPMGEPGVTGWATMMDAANLLRELAAEPEPDDFALDALNHCAAAIRARGASDDQG